MELKFTKETLAENNEIFININRKDIWFLLQEFIIIEIILNNKETLSSVEIQTVFEEFFFEDKKYLPTDYFEKSNSSGKSKLRDRLNNWVSSNLGHKKGLSSRKEILIVKKDKFNYFKVNPSLLSYFNEIELNTMSMYNFNKLYPYFRNYYNYVCNNLSSGFCGIHNKTAMKFIFKQKPTVDDVDLFKPTNSRLICEQCLIEDYKRG